MHSCHPLKSHKAPFPGKNVRNPDKHAMCSTYLLTTIIIKEILQALQAHVACAERKKKWFNPQTQQDLLFSTWPFPQTAVFLQCRSCLQLAKRSVSFVRQGKEREKQKTDCHRQAGRGQVSKKGKSKHLSVVFFLAQNSVPTVSEAKAGCKQMNNWKAQKESVSKKRWSSTVVFKEKNYVW